MKKIIILLIILNISSCGSNIEKRGYLFNDNMQQDIVSGMQKFEILQLMGSPSTTSSENGDKFYYIANSNQTHHNHLKPALLQLQVLYFYRYVSFE